MNEMLNNPFGLTETEIYVFGLGREHEKERIIKLLDEAKTYQQLERAIALIKGEK